MFHAWAMLPNIEEYLPYLDDLALSVTEKEELIGIVWTLMEHQVNQAFEGDNINLVVDDAMIDADSIH